MDGHYKDGEALLLLGDSYLLNNEKDKAEAIYKQINRGISENRMLQREQKRHKKEPRQILRGLVRKRAWIPDNQERMCIMIMAVFMGILPEVIQKITKDKGIRMYMTIIRKQKNPMEM